MTADVMEAFDKERTGFLSPSDFLTCVLEFNNGPFGIEGFSADQLNEYLSKFDLDKDWKLSEKEVKLFVIDWLKCTIQKFQKLLDNENWRLKQLCYYDESIYDLLSILLIKYSLITEKIKVND